MLAQNEISVLRLAICDAEYFGFMKYASVAAATVPIKRL